MGHWVHSDPGGITHRPDRVFETPPLLALITGSANENAAGLGPFERAIEEVTNALAQLQPPFDSETVRRALVEVHERIRETRKTLPYHVIEASASVLVVRDGHVEATLAGGGNVYVLSGGRVTEIIEPSTLLQSYRRTMGVEAADKADLEFRKSCTLGLRDIKLSFLGAGDPHAAELEVTQRRTEIQAGRIWVALSNGADRLFDHHVEDIERTHAGGDLGGLARRLCDALLARDRGRSVTALVLAP